MDIVDKIDEAMLGVTMFGTDPVFCGAKNEIIKLRKQLADCQWISVEDRLPEEGISVLVTCDGFVNKTCLLGNEFLMPSKRQSNGITHWMPLPNPPQAMSEKG